MDKNNPIEKSEVPKEFLDEEGYVREDVPFQTENSPPHNIQFFYCSRLTNLRGFVEKVIHTISYQYVDN